MSNQPSKPDQLRFSGPELGDLLDRVVTEHGEEAAIAAVNRIRSGGLAGFFCREEYEVIVDPDGEPAADGEASAEIVADEVGDIAPEGIIEDQTDHGSDTDTDDDHGLDTGDLDTDDDDETIAEVIGRAVEDRPPPRLALEEQPAVFGGPVSPEADPGRDRFLALLERRIDETSAVEDEFLLRRTPSARVDAASSDRLAMPVAPAPAPAALGDQSQDPLPTSTPEPAAAAATTTAVSGVDVSAATSRPAFWRRLDRTRDELASFLPAGSPRTAVVGPLPLASVVVRQLQATTELTSADVVVLTDRAGIVSEPSWLIERNGDRLIRTLEASGDRPTIVVIDVPTGRPGWLGPLQRRLRTVGVGLFRYTVAGQPTGPDLERYRQGADVPYAIDLTSRVEPGLVVALVADRHPVISVAGADLGPELLLALRRHVGAGERPDEPVIDG